MIVQHWCVTPDHLIVVPCVPHCPANRNLPCKMEYKGLSLHSLFVALWHGVSTFV